MKAMILAAGRGTRLRPLTDTVPKPLVNVHNRSLIEHLLLHLKDQGFREIVINVAYHSEQMIERLQSGACYGVNIVYSRESGRGLETGGGIFNALPLLGNEPFLVISGDIWTDYPLAKLRNHSLSGLAHLILVDNFDDHLGDFYLAKNQVTTNQGKLLTFGSIGLYHPDLFKHCAPGFFPLAPLLRSAIGNNQVTGEHFRGAWHNIGTLAALESLRLRFPHTS